MNTSYYAKYKGDNAVSIAAKCPHWFTGRQYKKLAPSYYLLMAYKNGEINEEQFVNRYYAGVLNNLDARQVYEELGGNSVLLCWEKSGSFCHRHIVAEWLQSELGVEITEL